MSTQFCPECGTKSEGNAFCSNCGTKLSVESGSNSPQYSNQSQSQPTAQPHAEGINYTGRATPQGRWGDPSGYQRPHDYQNTTSMTQRISGTLRLNVDVVEEIEAREDLQSEAMRLLVLNFAIIAILRTATVLTSSSYIVENELGSVVEIFLEVFVGGFAYVIFIAGIGSWIGGSQTNTSREEIIRVVSYAYVATSIELLLRTFIEYASGFVALIWLIVFLYQAIVFIFVIRRALDKGYITAIITLVIALIGRLFVIQIIYQITEAIFGSTYFIPV